MEQGSQQKWQKEVEAIMREEFGGDELSEDFQKAKAIIELADEVEPPSEPGNRIIALLLNTASEELRPLAAVYAGFQLGVAYERYQNANRA